mmetsp:Transcript_69735/g.167417  ORF Transcript_69735/g.167417 Transcript_69735/m.167417 type:complete len:212 (+) Transcript_69735:1525-2160(+)
MQGIVPSQLIHLLGQLPVGLHHHLWVGGLHAEDEVVVVMLAANLTKLNCRGNHAFGGIAILEQDALGQGAMVHTNSKRLTLLLKLQNQWYKTLCDIRLCLSNVFFCELGDGVERLSAICEVARVHADLVDMICHYQRNFGREVDVRHNWCGVAILKQLLLDLFASPRLRHTLHSDPDNVHTGVSARLDLSYGGLNVVGGSGGHCLSRDPVL